MSEGESNQILDNQSNLLQSINDLNGQVPIAKPVATNSFDDLPIGGNKKFEFTQFPQEGQLEKQPKKPLKKPPARFAKRMEEDAAKANADQPQAPIGSNNHENSNNLSATNPDDIPIGGSKFNFSQFPEDGQQPKKPLKKPPARFAKMQKTQNKQQQPADQNKEDKTKQIASTKNIDDIPIGGKNKFDEKPIGGSKKNNFDEQPIGGGNQNAFDEQPIGGGKKIQMSEYPQQGQVPKPAVKKAVKKATKAPVKAQISVDTPTNVPILDEVPVGGGNKGQFDEVPIGKGVNNFAMSQFPEGDEQQPAVETNYTMSQKLKSKAVKLKLSGMQDLLELLQKDPNNQQIAQIEIGKLLKQTNPACLEKILQCLKVWVEKGKKWGDDEAKSAIQNGYINGKPNTKKLTVEIVDEMYQKSPDVIEMALLVGLKGKVPKTLAGYIAFLNQLLAIYGMKRMKFFKPYFPDIVTILNRQKLVAVKTQGINILKEAYKWLTKQVVEPLTKQLKEGLKKQLDAFWQTHDKTQVMSAPKDIPQANDGKPKKKIDAYELSQAVDIFKKYNEKWSEQVIAQQKWSEKVRMMTQFVTAANVPKLAHNAEYRHMNELIRRLINHSNFNVVLWDLKIMAVLSKGLRRYFAPTVKAQFANVIGKFRDKKTQMVDETFNTLNQFNYCISIEDVIDDVKEGLGDKTPNMKVNLLNWIGKFVEKKVEQKDEVPQKAKEALRSLFPIFQKLLADGVAEVRDAMIKNIGKMKILMGDDFFAAMDKKMSKGQAGKLDQIKKQLPPKKVSREKDKKQSGAPPSKPPKDSAIKGSSKTIQNNSMVSNQAKGDISEEIQDIMPKMNHSDWQKRKQSAEALISLIGNNMDSKINSSVLFDLLNTLKTRIADPNKNIVKFFVQLTGLLFQMMPDRQVKNNAKNFLCALADGLSDKVQANRKQIAATINKIGGIYGRQQLLNMLGSYLDTDKQSRVQIINLILQNEQYIEKADIRDYPKGIIRGLTDKNKQIRSLSQKLLERVNQKLGLEVFKNLAKNERPAIAKDLNTLLSKYEGSKNLSSTLNKGVSPPKSKQMQQPPLAQTISAKKPSQRSESRNSKTMQQSFDNGQTDQVLPTQKQLYSTLQPGGNIIKHGVRSFIEGNQDFAPLKILSSERVHRQQKDERYPWMCDNIMEAQEDELRQSLQALFKSELAKKMLSIDYRKVIQAASQIIKLSKDIAHHNQIREVYDLILKWVFSRLWGGNPSVNMILQVLPHVMSILEKKKLVISDSEVDIIVAILRESFITGYMNQFKVSQSLYSITKLLIALSSGDRLLKKFLRQYSVQLTTIHRHVRRQATQFYRVGLSKLIKNQLMEYVGNGSSLEEASRIKELKNDPQFVELLYKRFHENVLDSFGFRNVIVSQQAINGLQPSSQKISPVPTRKVVQEPPYQPPAKQQPVQVQQASRSPQPVVPEGRPTISNVRPQQIFGRPTQTQRNLQNANKPNKQQDQEELDLRIYTMPPQGNPLGRHLAKLMTPGDIPDTIIAFFTNMFGESGDKISMQLTTYANIIFGAILKSVKYMLEHRNEQMPQKIVNQINLLQQAIKCKHITNHIDQQLLYQGTKFALYQLVYEDEHKNMIAQQLINKGIDFKPDQFVKVINGIMLRILENACPQQIVNILLNLLNKQLQMPHVSQKTISLIIKCLSRVSANYGLDINPQRTQQFILRAVQYFYIIGLQISLEEFNPHPEERLKPEDSIIKTLKQIILELIKLYGQQLWIHYENAMGHSKFTDNHVSQFIQFNGIAYPQNIQKMDQEDENIKKINELLSKSKTFDAGIVELRKYMTLNPNFIPVQYFTSRRYQQKFIIMVMNALQNSRPRRTPTKRQVREERSQNSRQQQQVVPVQSSIQDRIQRLKMRFDEVPQNRQQERPTIPVPATTTAVKKQEQRGEQRAQQIKRRIDQMRNRLNRN